MNLETALAEAARKARRDRPPVTLQEQERIIEQLRVNPLPVVKENTGRSIHTLCRIAKVAGL